MTPSPDTQRRYPRTLREAWPMDHRPSAIGIDGPPVIRCFAPWWVRAWRRIAALFQH